MLGRASLFLLRRGVQVETKSHESYSFYEGKLHFGSDVRLIVFIRIAIYLSLWCFLNEPTK